jgi:hypothetical protein
LFRSVTSKGAVPGQWNGLILVWMDSSASSEILFYIRRRICKWRRISCKSSVESQLSIHTTASFALDCPFMFGSPCVTYLDSNSMKLTEISKFLRKDSSVRPLKQSSD